MKESPRATIERLLNLAERYRRRAEALASLGEAQKAEDCRNLAVLQESTAHHLANRAAIDLKKS